MQQFLNNYPLKCYQVLLTNVRMLLLDADTSVQSLSSLISGLVNIYFSSSCFRRAATIRFTLNWCWFFHRLNKIIQSVHFQIFTMKLVYKSYLSIAFMKLSVFKQISIFFRQTHRFLYFTRRYFWVAMEIA
mgnify:CR=1 FL=1